ncbi:hypothetical protein E4631_25100 [Hymenobacter sp. UV11]|uniref:hypothetical protein n=1 Tax=Hymenobacter sp. UV11 TaxID=1849735 RepID=UPI00105B2655|nr:hypothetical protein [Hymenobacter sp. UV11]TDN38088.1 hypothetical protein A8B98_00545 [Hymenobacter sp. UV11]TFZ62490.1 hypothetical protein E4631_25100 [Hymenobacter sp. UV11]
MTKIYLDIDGVLLTAKHTQAAPGVAELVDFVTKYFDCYWLTTHCKGDRATAIRYLASYLSPSTLAQLNHAVQPTNWDALKTEAINLAEEFYWLEDRPFQAEIAQLEAAGVANRLLVVNLDVPQALSLIQATLQQVLSNEKSH